MSASTTVLSVPRVDKPASTATKSSAKRTLQESGFSEPEPAPRSREEKKPDPSHGVRDLSDISENATSSGGSDISDAEMSSEEEEPSISDSDDSETEWTIEMLEAANQRKYWNK